jgi:hypothetical protein
MLLKIILYIRDCQKEIVDAVSEWWKNVIRNKKPTKLENIIPYFVDGNDRKFWRSIATEVGK